MTKIVKIVNGVPATTSRLVASKFGKRHDNVVRAIQNLDCSEQFNQLNFEGVDYKDRKGEVRKEFIISQDGFAFLAMGFTGKKASEFKEEYINEFNRMRDFIKQEAARIQSRAASRLENPMMLRALKDERESQGKDTKGHHYSNENNLINLVVLGATAKKVRESMGLDKKDSLRDELYPRQIEAIEHMQRLNTSLIEIGMDYKERKSRLNTFFNKRFNDAILEEIIKIES